MIDQTLEAFIQRIGPFPERTVCLVGIGPGEAGLITVKGALRLRQADVAAYEMSYRPTAICNLLQENAQLVFVGPTEDRPRWTSAEIVEWARPHVEAGRRVVIVKSGDPFVFARGEQQVRALADAGLACEVVPAPTSALAAAAYAGVPLTDRNTTDAVSLVIGKADRDSALAEPVLATMAQSGMLAVYMGEDNLDALCRGLMGAGLGGDTPVSLVEHATRPKQRVTTGTIQTIAAQAKRAGVEQPAIAFIGSAAASQPQMRWFDRRPLFGQRILVTRPWHQSAVLAGRLTALGAEVIEAPTVAIEPLPDYDAVDEALRRLATYDWLVLTSANGVDALAERLRHLQMDARALASVRIAAIGPATAERLSKLFIEPDLIPEEFVAEA
ncbi:MAG: bifunctional uroporphyrinogen-III C-methyltransferase/uroporphyrinogen-III synthase, partial [Planctomycetota bacterium]